MNDKILNEKMYKVAVAIEEYIINTLPVEYQIFIFSGKIKINSIVSQILMECVKHTYETTQEKHSLNYYLKKYDLMEESERMLRSRTIDFINSNRLERHKYYKNKGLIINGLKPLQMNSISQKLEGYKFNEFQYWEINNVHNMSLVKAIVKNRMASKNFAFRNCANEYDGICMKLYDDLKKSDEQIVFNSMAMFTLEWKYYFDYLYEIADEMEKNNIKDIYNIEEIIRALCGTIAVETPLINNMTNVKLSRVYMDSRLIIMRRFFIKELVCNTVEKNKSILQLLSIVTALVNLVVTSMVYNGVPLKRWFVENTTIEDWASICKNYNVFSAFVKDKVWTNKKVRYVKNMYTKLKNPENRA